MNSPRILHVDVVSYREGMFFIGLAFLVGELDGSRVHDKVKDTLSKNQAGIFNHLDRYRDLVWKEGDTTHRFTSEPDLDRAAISMATEIYQVDILLKGESAAIEPKEVLIPANTPLVDEMNTIFKAYQLLDDTDIAEVEVMEQLSDEWEELFNKLKNEQRRTTKK